MVLTNRQTTQGLGLRVHGIRDSLYKIESLMIPLPFINSFYLYIPHNIFIYQNYQVITQCPILIPDKQLCHEELPPPPHSRIVFLLRWSTQTTEEFRALLIQSKTQLKDFIFSSKFKIGTRRNDRIRSCQYHEIDSYNPSLSVCADGP